jgi:hypothetical protein
VELASLSGSGLRSKLEKRSKQAHRIGDLDENAIDPLDTSIIGNPIDENTL